MDKKDLKLSFYGGAGSVTGANFMLEGSDKKILIDCGLYQGRDYCEEESCLEFKYNPANVNALLVTHAHADHIGRIPKLVHDGFNGPIYSTDETKQIAEIMLGDGLKFVIAEAKELGRDPIYLKEDILRTISLWKSVPYHENLKLDGGFTAYFKDAGHILGSAIIELSYENKMIAFSGDLGNSPTPFLKDTEPVTDASYLIIESVYGDRLHEGVKERTEKLKRIIKETIGAGGTLLIPAFSVSRTQILLHEINNMVEKGEIPSVPVYLDSPLGIRVTEVYKNSQKNFKESAKSQIKGGDDIFDFPRLEFTLSPNESKAINRGRSSKIIIASAGMSTGGRILHHEKRYLSDPKTTLLFVGYQAPGSLGRIIQEGAKEVEINRSVVKINARLETITGYSAHRDRDGLMAFVEKAIENGKLKKVFVVMGEPRSSMFLAQRIKDYLGIEAVSPEEGESFTL